MPALIGELLREIQQQLSPVSRDLARKDAEQIFEHVCHLSRSELYTRAKQPVSAGQKKAIHALAAKRLTGTPLPYVIGYTYFYAKIITVTPDVLIPRPDTEILIETVLHNEKNKHCRFIDIGTGSGNIAGTLSDARPRWHGIAIDISIQALRIARTNCPDRVSLLCSDKLSAVRTDTPADFIVSNPPYVSLYEMQTLDTSVRAYEPYIGLYGGIDGLDFYHYLAQHSKPFLKNNGALYCEIGAMQGKRVATIFRDNGWKEVTLFRDLAERERVLRAKKG